jgi:hypothetical protein
MIGVELMTIETEAKIHDANIPQKLRSETPRNAFRGGFDLSQNAENVVLNLSRVMIEPMRGWNGWYHCTVHTYGSWLRGDPRGWRSRHHREHVIGDYKHPPPEGMYDKLYERSKKLMRRDPVRLEKAMRRLVLRWITERLNIDGVPWVVGSLGAKHLHVLAKFVDHHPRHWMGLAKKHASHRCRERGIAKPGGGLWGKRSRAEPVSGRPHQLRVVKYIMDHAREGAAIITNFNH